MRNNIKVLKNQILLRKYKNNVRLLKIKLNVNIVVRCIYIAGTGIEPILQDYEPCELPLLYPANIVFIFMSKLGFEPKTL